ncbi:MAG: SagB/ThcOx family dehydrogenase [Bacteroidales bacterium]|jgi:SagB-type dehydrogenase family enzyme
MKKIIFSFISAVLLIVGSMIPGSSFAQDITLIPPQKDGGMPLMKALNNRHTSREFAGKDLSAQQLSNLFWAACGFNRPGEKKRTAPSAMNNQEIDVYVATAKGLYVYNPEKHVLTQVLKDDIRDKTGKQDFVKTAPLTLVYVADYDKMGKSDDKTRDGYSMADASFISENVYLYCASEGLNTGVRAYIDKDILAKAMNLKPSQHIVLAQCVGFPPEK